MLLDNGADHKACTLEGWQPLHCAARWGNYEIAHALIAAGADINATSNGGMTPLHLAANEKYVGYRVNFFRVKLSIYVRDCLPHDIQVKLELDSVCSDSQMPIRLNFFQSIK